jgi:hypothetical protein
MDELTRLHREFLRDTVRRRVDFSTTGQSRGLPPPPLQKPYAGGSRTIELAAPERFAELNVPSLLSVLESRRSIRRFSRQPLSLLELSFLGTLR